ncbi:DUF2786 domain-containing protein [Corynebacterium suicordis]|uniref:DUF2786 domain-containing protein n=1 Tax=Corynebacterium suicordis DSM 45110 TaxID=1121369 RepID=A0ABR9ZLX1_9CORY|nr:DUF2786 domain-containing protein [Corynebacterium suicordis]MBF4554445.1 DUF2786 domain-containing protein [Corynebacterium suicordis DSM 45110]MDR6278619.1 hypothetical protein [Corynebacterium suicordis]
MTHPEGIERKIKALLEMARSRAGQPDEEAFRSRALEMMAKYGINERDLAQGTADEMIHEKVSLSGAYTDCQGQLLGRIAKALHCEPVLWTTRNSNKISHVEIFGRNKHVKRVMMMFSYLNPYMLTQAKRASLDDFIGVSTVLQRRSWMQGFAQTIAHRLQEIEDGQSREFDTAKDKGEIVLLSDAQAARQALNEAHGRLRTRQSKNRLDPQGFSSGSSAGHNVDLGQQRVDSRKALNR